LTILNISYNKKFILRLKLKGYSLEIAFASLQLVLPVDLLNGFREKIGSLFPEDKVNGS